MGVNGTVFYANMFGPSSTIIRESAFIQIQPEINKYYNNCYNTNKI